MPGHRDPEREGRPTLGKAQALVPQVRRVIAEARLAVAEAAAASGATGASCASTAASRASTAAAPAWLADATDLLPPGRPLDGAVCYLTYGYDIGVVSDGRSASVNLAHPLLRAGPGLFRVYAAHELHHAGYLRYRPLPSLRDIGTKEGLVGLVRALTHLEGLGVRAGWLVRQRLGLAGFDPDYAALEDEERMALLEARFRGLYQDLGTLPGRLGATEVEATLEAFGSPDKLLHLVGARLAERVELRLGRRPWFPRS